MIHSALNRHNIVKYIASQHRQKKHDLLRLTPSRFNMHQCAQINGPLQIISSNGVDLKFLRPPHRQQAESYRVHIPIIFSVIRSTHLVDLIPVNVRMHTDGRMHNVHEEASYKIPGAWCVVCGRGQCKRCGCGIAARIMRSCTPGSSHDDVPAWPTSPPTSTHHA